MSYSEWMQRVDVILEAECGLSSADLEDANYADMYDDGYTPEAAAEEVLEANGYDAL